MIIRLIQEEDLPDCGRIYASVFNVPPYKGLWQPDEAAEMLGGLLERDPESCWCIESNGEILGFAFCTVYGSFRATIQEFAISTAVQRRGLGTLLMEHLLTEFERRNLRAVDLVAHRKTPAYKFYRKFGFEPPENYSVMAKLL